MALYALFGSGYNQVARCSAALTTSGVLSGFSVAGLYDGRQTAEFFFAAAAGDKYIDLDLNQTVNGDFATAFSGGHPGTGWAGSGTPTATQSSGAMLVSGAAGSYEYFDLSVAAGEVLTMSATLTAPGVGGLAQIVVRNLETGKLLDGVALTWQTSAVFLSQPGSAALPTLTKTATFTVESHSTCLSDRVTLRVEFYGGPGAGATFPSYDNFFIYPRINFASIHAHNIPAGILSHVRFGSIPTATPGATMVADFTQARPTMFAAFTAQDQRYARFYFTTLTAETREIYIGEFVLGQYRSLERVQNYGYTAGTIDPSDRSSNDLGPQQAYRRTQQARRWVELQFRLTTATSYAEWVELMARSCNGALPLILVPDSADAGDARLGRLAQEWQYSRALTLMRDHSIKHEELPFPVVID